MGGQVLAEPDPPSKYGIRTGGPDPDLLRYYQGASLELDSSGGM
jgi:hypothetical protein